MMKQNKTLNIASVKNSLGKYYLIFASVVALVFGNTVFNGYNMDDHLVTQNHIYTSKGLSAIKAILTSNYYSNNSDINFGYRPLVHISFAIEHQFLGEHAGVSHFINLLLYLITVCLFFKLCVKWFGENNINIAFLASLIFALHPVHTEAVASIKNRDELLALLFGLVSVYCITKYTTNLAFKWVVYSFIAFTLGMLAKTSIYPIAVIVPSTLMVLGQTTFKKSLFKALLLSIPAAVIGSDLQLYRGVILLLLPFLGLIFTHVFINFSNYTTFLKTYLSKIPIKFILIILSLSVYTLGFTLKEITIITFSIALTVLSLKTNRLSSMLILALQITLVAFLFDVKVFHKYALVFAIACIVQGSVLSQRKKIDYLILALATLPLIAYLSVHKSLISASIFIEIALYFLLLNKRAIWGLAFILFSTTLSAILFQSSFFHYLLIGYAILKVLNENVMSEKLTFEKSLIKLSIIIVATTCIFFSNQVHSPLTEKFNQQYQRFQSEYLNNKPSKNTENGRKVNYIENTLSGQYTRAEILATGFATIAEYARLTLYPAELSFYYGYAKAKTVNFSDKTAWLGFLFYVSLIVIALWQLNKNTLLSIGIAWYLLNISLFSNWFEPVAGMVGERLAYTASVGFCLAVSAYILKLKPSFSLFKPKGFELVIILVLILFSMRSISRNSDWKDPLTLMSHDISHLDNSAQAHNLLALNFMYISSIDKNLSQQKIIEMQNKAALHLQKSIEIYPYFFNTNFDLARVYIGLGDYTKAKPALEQALKIDSENLFALEELAKTCYELKQVDETEKYANMYLAKIPQNENMHEILIYNMLANGKYESALYYAERAMSYYPNNQIIQRMYADAKKLSDSSMPKNQ